jgi:putative transposase
MVPIEDAPRGYGPNKTLYDRFNRWSRLGVFELCLP